jgi:hypothetical protein
MTMIMAKKHIKQIATGFVALLLAIGQASAGKHVPIIPVQGKNVSVLVNGKETNYYLLSTKTPLWIEVDGPGKFLVVSRLVFPGASTSTMKYSISVVDGKTIVKTHSTQTEKSDATMKASRAILGKSRKGTIEIPEGSHKYELRLEKTEASDVAVKLYFVPAKGTAKEVTIEALSYDRVVTAMAEEKLITYYVCSANHKVQVRVVGPTRMKVSLRLNYDESMKGGQKYAVSVWEGSKQVLLKPLSTTKALGVSYKEWKDVIPGKVNVFYHDIPSGEHIYRLELQESVARSVSLKFSLPQKDLDNEG